MNDPVGLRAGPASAQLADWSLAHPDQLATAMRLIAAGGRSNDSALHARQFLEQALSAGGMGPLASADYRSAAALLHRDQHSLALGDVMEALADAGAELRATVPAWHARYAARPETQLERQAAAQLRTGEVKESGQAARGLDGAWYTRAWYPRSGKPAVVVTSSALSEEIVNFANAADARSWLESRSPATVGPLRTTANGPVTRTAREEELLAFLIRDPRAGRGVITALAKPDTWTTHLRAELFAAWRWATAEGGAPGYGVIAAAYTRRLLRAPAAAAEDIGWPGATRAIAYLQRLAATPVTPAQASAAVTALAEADTTARAQRPPAGSAPTSHAALSGQRQAKDRQLLQPPPQAPGRGSPVPRL